VEGASEHDVDGVVEGLLLLAGFTRNGKYAGVDTTEFRDAPGRNRGHGARLGKRCSEATLRSHVVTFKISFPRIPPVLDARRALAASDSSKMVSGAVSVHRSQTSARNDLAGLGSLWTFPQLEFFPLPWLPPQLVGAGRRHRE
jgi:hypothetical protein